MFIFIWRILLMHHFFHSKFCWFRNYESPKLGIKHYCVGVPLCTKWTAKITEYFSAYYKWPLQLRKIHGYIFLCSLHFVFFLNLILMKSRPIWMNWDYILIYSIRFKSDLLIIGTCFNEVYPIGPGILATRLWFWSNRNTYSHFSLENNLGEGGL